MSKYCLTVALWFRVSSLHRWVELRTPCLFVVKRVDVAQLCTQRCRRWHLLGAFQNWSGKHYSHLWLVGVISTGTWNLVSEQVTAELWGRIYPLATPFSSIGLSLIHYLLSCRSFLIPAQKGSPLCDHHPQGVRTPPVWPAVSAIVCPWAPSLNISGPRLPHLEGAI